jgi:hypothetical protein
VLDNAKNAAVQPSNTILEFEPAVDQILGMNGEVRSEKGFLESFDPHLSDVFGGWRSDETDPSMAQPEQVMGGDAV